MLSFLIFFVGRKATEKKMEILKKYLAASGVSGCEKEISKIIAAEIKDYVDEVYEDTLGNLIAHKKGKGKKIMLAAHMDEIGIVVTFAEENGFLRFSAVGGVYTKELLGRRVVFSNGIKGVIYTEKENKDLQMSKMYIDIGAKSKEDAEKSIKIGDTAVFEGTFSDNGGRIISKALDNRAGCYVLTEAAKRVSGENDIYFVFTSQEEVGLRGARCAAFAIEPDAALAVDVTDTGDTPECEPNSVKLGGGACVKIMDRSIICDSDIRTQLIETAKKNNIPYQLEIMTDGGTDAGAIHLTKEGIKTGGISIPVRYIHSPSEMADFEDIKACIELTAAFAAG